MNNYVSAEERREAASRALEEVEGARKSPPPGGEVAARIAHQAVTSALVDLHDALIALEAI